MMDEEGLSNLSKSVSRACDRFFIHRGICNIALGMHDQVRAMLPRLGTCSSFCALRASFPPRRSQHPD